MRFVGEAFIQEWDDVEYLRFASLYVDDQTGISQVKYNNGQVISQTTEYLFLEMFVSWYRDPLISRGIRVGDRYF